MPERKMWTLDRTMRLDQALVEHWPGLARAEVRTLIQQGGVQVNGQLARKAGQYLQPGDVIEAPEPVLAGALPDAEAEAPVDLLLEGAEIEFRYEDELLVILEKPAGMPLQATRGYHGLTVTDVLKARYPDIEHIGGVQRAGIVQRLEPEVSGLLLVAREEGAYRTLQRAVRHQQVETTYLGLVEGELTGQGVIEEAIGNVGRSRTQMAVTRQGRPAQTAYRVLRHYKDERRDYTLVEIRPQSSRMHQIRVHLSWWGYPLVGDRLYGSRFQPLGAERIFLHLSVMVFPHPVTGESMRWESALPPELRTITHYLNRPKR